MTDLEAIWNDLHSSLSSHSDALDVKKDKADVFEVGGTKPVMQGKQKVDGHYFASLMRKPKDVRFYYFPIYTHANDFTLSPEAQKLLKGKSCFHVKKLDEATSAELKAMIAKGVELYKKDGLI